MVVLTTAAGQLNETRVDLRPSSPDARPGHRLARCPRPACGGRLFMTALDLEETAAVCMLCARPLDVDRPIGMERMS
jgi:hypothetical protein